MYADLYVPLCSAYSKLLRRHSVTAASYGSHASCGKEAVQVCVCVCVPGSAYRCSVFWIAAVSMAANFIRFNGKH